MVEEYILFQMKMCNLKILSFTKMRQEMEEVYLLKKEKILRLTIQILLQIKLALAIYIIAVALEGLQLLGE